MLGKIDEVALADGVPPRNKPGNPDALRYLIAHRNGENLNSAFTSVIEPYKGERFIQSIQPAEIQANGTLIDLTEDITVRAVKVELTNGRTDYIISSLDPDVSYTIDDKLHFKGHFGVYSEKNGEQVYGYVNNGTSIGKIENPSISGHTGGLDGTIIDFTKELSVENSITVEMDLNGLSLDSLVDRFIYIQNDGERNAAYQIKDAVQLENNKYELDIADITLVRSYIDPDDFSKGFNFNIEEGSDFRIPLSSEVAIAGSSIEKIMELVHQFRAEGIISGEATSRHLQMHLIAIEQYEETDDLDKAVKHLKSFRTLLNHQKENDLILGEAVNILTTHVDNLISRWE